VKEIASKFASADFQIFVGWRPKKVPKVPVFFGLEEALLFLFEELQPSALNKTATRGGPSVPQIPARPSDLQSAGSCTTLIRSFADHVMGGVLQCHFLPGSGVSLKPAMT